MRCDRCEREATVHEVVKDQDAYRETHLCEQCGSEQGIQVHPQAPLSAIVSVTMGPAVPQTAGCPDCGMSYSEFAKSGLVGCGTCYSTFEDRLGPLIERAHDGATHHIGKEPRRARQTGPSAQDEANRARKLAQLKKQLDEALRAEHYELAALLRDELRRFSSGEDQGGEESGSRSRPGGDS